VVKFTFALQIKQKYKKEKKKKRYGPPLRVRE
jgi:hypothetical protein